MCLYFVSVRLGFNTVYAAHYVAPNPATARFIMSQDYVTDMTRAAIVGDLPRLPSLAKCKIHVRKSDADPAKMAVNLPGAA